MDIRETTQQWFEMKDVRKRELDGSVWIPLRAFIENSKGGEYGYEGYISELYGLGTLAVPIEAREAAKDLGWSQIGAGVYQAGYFSGEKYIPSDLHLLGTGEHSGLHLMLAQAGNGEDHEEWHLHQDLAIALGLKREEDDWLAFNRGYEKVARLTRTDSGAPSSIEIKASYLKDYLLARNMALLASSYRERVSIVKHANGIDWPHSPLIVDKRNERWEGTKMAIHEGGNPFGQEIAVHRVSRTDVDPEVDVPGVGFETEGGTVSESRIVKSSGPKLFRVAGALWKTEWVEPGENSPIVRGDKLPARSFFVTNAEGKEESKETLSEKSHWLWFRPEVIVALAQRRGGALSWATRNTGGIRCSPDHLVHFGVNSIGLVNVYAKDVAQLPDWQQKIWAGHNVGPEGKVSRELLDSQMEARPAKTLAPEVLIPRGLRSINELTEAKFGTAIIRDHPSTGDIARQTHRFRSTNRRGLLSLAKDLTRLTADSIDVKSLRKILELTDAEDQKLGSLKLLERLLAKKVSSDKARELMGPLFGAYDLRQGDAHLPSKNLDQPLKLVGVDQSEPFVIQGFQMLDACAKAIAEIIEILNN